MPTYKIGLGKAAEGRNKETNKRQFRTMLSTGVMLEVFENKETSVSVNEVDESMLHSLASRDFIALSESAAAAPQQTASRAL